MADREQKGVVGRVISAAVLVCGGILALWENEGRFNHYKAARAARVVSTPADASAGETVCVTGDLDTGIPIAVEYVEQFTGYHVVWREAEIYSWRESTDSDGHTTWSKGWYGSLDRNSRNTGIRQTLSSDALYPPEYRLGGLEIVPARIHFVDDDAAIPCGQLALARAGQRAGLQPGGDYFFKGAGSLGAPALGDERVGFRGVRNTPTATYFGLVAGGVARGKQFDIAQSLVSGIIKNDGILHHLVNGDRDAALATMKGHFHRLQWMVRLGGTAAVVIGVQALFGGFVNLLYAIPLIGRLAETAVLLVSLIIGVTISVAVMLAAIVAHHPWTVAAPLALVVVGFLVFRWRAKHARRNVRQSVDRLQEEDSSPIDELLRRESLARRAETTFTNLAKLALADGGLSKKENKHLVRWGKRSGLTEDRLKELFAQAKREGGDPEATDRADLTLLTCLALRDGVLSTKELSVLNGFGKKLGMTAHDVRKVIVRLERGALPAG